MTTTARAVDFSNVKEGGNFNRNRIPAGDYIATIVKVEDSPAKSDGVFQYLFTIKVDKYPTRAFPYYCKLQENQLWKLRNLLIAAGITVPKRKVKVDPNRAVGKRIGVTIEDGEYEGKEQSDIAAVFPAAELADGNQTVEDDDDLVDDVDAEEEVDEEVDADDEDVEDDAEEEADPYADLDRTQLKAEIKKLESDFVAKKSQSDDDLRAYLIGLAGTGGGVADDDEEDEEDEPAPAPRRKAAAAAPARRKGAKAAVSDDDLEELDIDSL